MVPSKEKEEENKNKKNKQQKKTTKQLTYNIYYKASLNGDRTTLKFAPL